MLKNNNRTQKIYRNFKKPSWSPPAWLFGPVWTFLYLLIFISYGYVFYNFYSGNINWIMALPFILNLIFNFSFTYFQFKLKNNYLASLDIILVLVTIVWEILAIYSFSNTIAYLQIPYLLWVSFATILQFSVTYLNKK